MENYPNGANCLALEVKWDQQGFFNKRRDLAKIREIALGMRKEQRDVAIEDGAAWTNSRGVLPPK